MMNREFVPFEQSLGLKELGFDEPCMCRYYSIDTIEDNNIVEDGYRIADTILKYREKQDE